MNTKIIADVGSNWITTTDLFRSISAAKECGAHFVKFQAFTHADLYGYHKPFRVNERSQFELDWIPALARKCKEVNIGFMCTAFNPDYVDLIDEYAPMHKVASSDINYIPLLKKLADTKKKVLVSTGAADYTDIHNAIKIIGDQKINLMYCVSEYPATEVDLTDIEVLKSVFGVKVGFSDHTTDIYNAPFFAKFYAKANFIEKHFTVIPEVDTPDRDHSLAPYDFLRMTQRLFARENHVEDRRIYDKDMLEYHKRRCVAIEPIPKGSKFAYGKNFGFYRIKKEETWTPKVADPIWPEDASALKDSKAVLDIPVGRHICWNDIE